MPNVQRASPVVTSVPTAPSSTPAATMTDAFSTEPGAVMTATTRPKTISDV